MHVTGTAVEPIETLSAEVLRVRLADMIRSGVDTNACVQGQLDLEAAERREADVRDAATRRQRISGDIQRRQNEVEREKTAKQLADIDAKMFDHAPTVTVEYAGRSVTIRLASAEPHSPLVAAEALKRIAQAVGQAFQQTRGDARKAGRVLRTQWDTTVVKDYVRQAVTAGLVESQPPTNGKTTK